LSRRPCGVAAQRDEKQQPAADARILVPRELPFLESLSWDDRRWRKLSPFEMLQRYEAGWRWPGVLADPTDEELAFVRSLLRAGGSVLRR